VRHNVAGAIQGALIPYASVLKRRPGLELGEPCFDRGELGLVLGGVGANIGAQLIERFGSAIGPIIAAGCGHLGEEKYEQHANTLLVEHQLKLLKAIIGLTFPNGIISFVEAAMALLPGAGEGEKPVTVRLRKSPSPSQPSSDGASRPIMQ
jgi:hypothetical protein